MQVAGGVLLGLSLPTLTAGTATLAVGLAQDLCGLGDHPSACRSAHEIKTLEAIGGGLAAAGVVGSLAGALLLANGAADRREARQLELSLRSSVGPSSAALALTGRF